MKSSADTSQKTGKTKRTGKKGKLEKERVDRILKALDGYYGTDLRCYLNYSAPWQLLVAVILSAQCTDARVNLITKDLFQKYPTLESLAAADLSELEQDIHSAGFYHHKAKNILLCTHKLLSDHQGNVPSSIEELTALAGVGRKTANVIRGTIYGIDSIVVDTHVGRISRKLGLTEHTDPEQVEHDLEQILPKDHWININFQLIAHGRSICTARKPDCGHCFLREDCPGANFQKILLASPGKKE